MTDAPRALIYGATGYTGRLIAREAARRGLPVMLGGRNAASLRKLADGLHLPFLAFAIADAPRVAEGLRAVPLVFNCAGPFVHTARPMIEACLAAGADYLDITGEIEVIELAAGLSERAQAAGIALCPAVGFDVVPSDCLAAMLAARLPEATHLQLAISSTDRFSPGTAKTVLEMLPSGGRVRLDGQIKRVPPAWKTMEIPFRDGPKLGVTIPWGDVASAFYSTGIPNIEVFAATTPKDLARLRRMRFLAPLVRLPPVRALARSWIGRNIHGPSEAQLQNGTSSLWGRVTNAKGSSVSATLETLSGYALTAQTAMTALERASANPLPRGFCTPSQAFGQEFILEFPRTDLVWHES